MYRHLARYSYLAIVFCLAFLPLVFFGQNFYDSNREYYDQLTVSPGTDPLPGLAGEVETDTGLRIQSNNILTMVTGGIERFSIRGNNGGVTMETGTLRYTDTVDVASAATTLLDPGNMFHITGTTAITTINNCNAGNNGRLVTLIFDAGLTVTQGNNLKLAGNFATTVDDVLQLMCDGSDWFEISRSANF